MVIYLLVKCPVSKITGLFFEHKYQRKVVLYLICQIFASYIP